MIKSKTFYYSLFFSSSSCRIGIPDCVWTDIAERKHKKIRDKQVEQMNKLGWRIIRLEENGYGASPVFRRAFIFFQKILFAIKDPMNKRFLSDKTIKRQ